MAQVVAVANQKGGVAKTFTSRQFATCLANKGFRVLAVDGDPQQDLTRQFGITEEDLKGGETLTSLIAMEIDNRTDTDTDDKYEYDTADAILCTDDNVDLLSATISLSSIINKMPSAMNRDYIMRDILKQVQDDYDYIIIDCPPNLGFLVINHLFASDKVLIPAFTDEQSLTSMHRLVSTIKNVEKNDVTDHYITVDGILFTNVKENTKMAEMFMALVKKTFPLYSYENYIPSSVSAQEAVANHTSIFEHDEKGKVAQAYLRFTEEFLKKEVDEIKNDAMMCKEDAQSMMEEAKELEASNDKADARKAERLRRKAEQLIQESEELLLDAEELREKAGLAQENERKE